VNGAAYGPYADARSAVLDRDTGLQQRIEQLFGEIAAAPKPPGWPSREEMSASVGGGRG